MAKRDFVKTRAASCTNVDLSGNRAHEAVVGSLLVSVYKLTAEVKALYSCHTGGVTDHSSVVRMGYGRWGYPN